MKPKAISFFVHLSAMAAFVVAVFFSKSVQATEFGCPKMGPETERTFVPRTQLTSSSDEVVGCPGENLGVQAILKIYGAEYRRRTVSEEHPQGEELTIGKLQEANPRFTFPICRDGTHGTPKAGDRSQWDACPMEKRDLGLMAWMPFRIPFGHIETREELQARAKAQKAELKELKTILSVEADAQKCGSVACIEELVKKLDGLTDKHEKAKMLIVALGAQAQTLRGKAPPVPATVSKPEDVSKKAEDPLKTENATLQRQNRVLFWGVIVLAILLVAAVIVIPLSFRRRMKDAEEKAEADKEAAIGAKDSKLQALAAANIELGERYQSLTVELAAEKEANKQAIVAREKHLRDELDKQHRLKLAQQRTEIEAEYAAQAKDMQDLRDANAAYFREAVAQKDRIAELEVERVELVRHHDLRGKALEAAQTRLASQGHDSAVGMHVSRQTSGSNGHTGGSSSHQLVAAAAMALATSSAAAGTASQNDFTTPVAAEKVEAPGVSEHDEPLSSADAAEVDVAEVPLARRLAQAAATSPAEQRSNGVIAMDASALLPPPEPSKEKTDRYFFVKNGEVGIVRHHRSVTEYAGSPTSGRTERPGIGNLAYAVRIPPPAPPPSEVEGSDDGAGMHAQAADDDTADDGQAQIRSSAKLVGGANPDASNGDGNGHASGSGNGAEASAHTGSPPAHTGSDAAIDDDETMVV